MKSWSLFLILCCVQQTSTTMAFDIPFLKALVPPNTGQQNKAALAQEYLTELEGLIAQAPKNGIDTPADLESQILETCQQLESCNPTPKPVTNTDKMNGFWKMSWTNFAPAAPSCGKLGPLVGTVYQDILLGESGVAKNILKIDLPPIAGELVAAPSVVNDSTVAIAFESVGNKLAGILPLGPQIQFEKNKEIRLWEHVYLDDTYRIIYARRQEETDASLRGFLYIMKRADEERFETGV